MKIKYLGFIAAAAATLVSCYSEKKAIDQTDKALKIYPDLVANIARKNFPCITTSSIKTTDSTAYKQWQDSVNKLNSFYQDLINSIEPVEIHDTITAGCEGYEANEQKYRQELSVKNRLIIELNRQIREVKPIHDTVKKLIEDSAKIKLLGAVIDIKERQLEESKKRIDQLDNDKKDLQTKLSKRNKLLLYLVIFCCGSGAVSYFQFRLRR